MAESTRWNISVSTETDRAVRILLANQGGGRKGDLSRFIEEAVRQRVFEETAQDIKRQNAELSSSEVDTAVREALEWARQD